MEPRFLIPLVLLFLAALAPAQENQPTDADKASQSQVDSYVAAFNKGDARALAALYAEDTQYTSDEGVAVVGRGAVLENLTKFFAKNKGAKLEVRVDSARFLTPDVLLEKGFATVNDETTRYVQLCEEGRCLAHLGTGRDDATTRGCRCCGAR